MDPNRTARIFSIDKAVPDFLITVKMTWRWYEYYRFSPEFFALITDYFEGKFAAKLRCDMRVTVFLDDLKKGFYCQWNASYDRSILLPHHGLPKEELTCRLPAFMPPVSFMHKKLPDKSI